MCVCLSVVLQKAQNVFTRCHIQNSFDFQFLVFGCRQFGFVVHCFSIYCVSGHRQRHRHQRKLKCELNQLRERVTNLGWTQQYNNRKVLQSFSCIRMQVYCSRCCQLMTLLNSLFFFLDSIMCGCRFSIFCYCKYVFFFSLFFVWWERSHRM